MSLTDIENIDSQFRFVLVSARRAEQLVRGARPRIELPGQKLTRIAMEEVRRGSVDWTIGAAPPEPEAVAESEDAATTS